MCPPRFDAVNADFQELMRGAPDITLNPLSRSHLI